MGIGHLDLSVYGCGTRGRRCCYLTCGESGRRELLPVVSGWRTGYMV
jgi:hypothetical protein